MEREGPERTPEEERAIRRVMESAALREQVLRSYEAALNVCFVTSPESVFPDVLRALLAEDLGTTLGREAAYALVLAVKLFEAQGGADGKVDLHYAFTLPAPETAEHWTQKAGIMASNGWGYGVLACLDKALSIDARSADASLHSARLLRQLGAPSASGSVTWQWGHLASITGALRKGLDAVGIALAARPGDALAFKAKADLLLELARPSRDRDILMSAAAALREARAAGGSKDFESLANDWEAAARRLPSPEHARVLSSPGVEPEQLSALFGRWRQLFYQSFPASYLMPPLTAADTLEELTALHQRNPWVREQFPTAQKLQKAVDSLITTDRFAATLRMLTGSMSDAMRGYISRHVACGESMIRKVNAYCGPMPQVNAPQCWAILVNRGLAGVFHQLMEIMLARVEVMEAPGVPKPRLGHLLEYDEVVRASRDVVDAYVWHGTVYSPPKVEPADGRLSLMAFLTGYSNMFIVAHELAHALLDHRGLSTPDRELEADHLGFAIVLNQAMASGSDLTPALAVAGAEISLSFLGFIEARGSLVPPPEPPNRAAATLLADLAQKSATHPPALSGCPISGTASHFPNGGTTRLTPRGTSSRRQCPVPEAGPSGFGLSAPLWRRAVRAVGVRRKRMPTLGGSIRASAWPGWTGAGWPGLCPVAPRAP